ncbi:MAG TPA: isochorismatase family cysteine hydrolase [Polyangiaceae bacterium]|jgi:nicotinamidase-related amidase
MNAKLTVDPKTSALLVMDFQTAVVEMIATEKDGLLARTAHVIDAARKAGMKIVYVVVAFRPGYPEVSPRHPSFGPIRETGRFIEGSAGTEVHAAVAPKPGDVTITKHRVSAFAGTDLDMILRSNGIDTLVLAGIATSGVVLSTVRHASDADYRLVVVEDCCADRDAEVHRVLTEKVFARQTTVVKSEAVVGALGAAG